MTNNTFKNLVKNFVIFLPLLLFSVYMYPQTNLVADSGFEHGAAVWDISQGATRVSSDAQSGSFAVRAVDNGGVNQNITGLSPNTTYVLSGWLKSNKNAPVQLGVKWYGGNELTLQTSSTTYTLLSIKFTTGSASTTAVIYGFNPRGGSNLMNVDELSVAYSNENPYKLVWSDEFNGNGVVDTANWSFENGFARNEEIQWYQTENAIQQDGNLIIEGRKENPFNARPNPNYAAGSTDWRKSRKYINYSSSSIKTDGKQSWLYGRFEIRAKITNQTGTWPAIWTLGNNCEWPSNGEVDIMENYGGNILANFAWGTNARSNPKWDSVKLNTISNFVKKDPDWISKFHIWTLDWDVNKMSIYLDDKLINEIDLSKTINGTANCLGDNPFRKKQYLLLNLALGGQGGSVTNLAFPTQYIIDYVRVYQLDAQ
ncbi:family 16 glycosylhydrolase [Flavobacterium sp.]|uniref:family 16 glycosylhydrolase n=1 Tax=Flavobacterium sp. TaxID=239 RepID=UPI00286E8155|nr:family 16 glycosylhydrolase [Flavobacterium sp.]